MTVKIIHRRRTAAEVAALSLAEIATAIHGDGDYALGSQIPAATYSVARDLAESMGLVGASARKKRNAPLQHRVDVNAPPKFDIEITKCRLEFSEAECRRYLVQSNRDGNKDNYSNLVKTDAAKAARLRKAAESYGIVPARIERPTPKPKVESDGRFQISPEIAQKANLPLDTRLNADEFAQLVSLLNPPPVEPSDAK